ncbi:MAG: septum site-determining protein MinD [Chloroflexaceae bacterium]|nr:septum site-determining protein MinD [Chloroflexaceae bacterium]NJO05466.1 septum site-determining protein MinD [Chloroflexaceae bacterium]
MARVITVTSGKGGVGKTTTTANLGTALAIQGARVVVIDADIGLRNLDVVMGLENRIVYDLVDVVEGRARLRQSLIKDKRVPELYLLPAAQTRDKDAVSSDDMIDLTNQLRQEYDFVLIDCPAGIETGFKNAIAGADEILIVTTPEVSAVRDADRVVGLVEAAEKGPPRLIINRLNPRLVAKGEMLSMDEVVEILALEPIGVVPEDEHIVSSTNRGEAAVFNQSSQAGRAFHNIARRLNGEHVPLLEPTEQNGVFDRLFGGLFGRRART